MKKISLDIIGIVGVPARYGGFETLVERLLQDKDFSKTFNTRVFCSTNKYQKKYKSFLGAKLFYLPLNANGIQSILYDALSIFISIFSKSEAILILGTSGAIFMPFIKTFTSKKLVVNIDGMEWKRDKWSPITRFILKFFERVAVKCSDVVITDNEVITKYVKTEYDRDSSLISYGGDNHVSKSICPSFLNKKKYYLSICRIEKENNVKLILDAFAKNKKKHLYFIGNWEASKYGRSLKKTYSQLKNINLIDPIYDESKLNYLRKNADGYLHGHSAGGTNPSLVETMFFETTIFAFDCEFNRSTLNNMGIYFQDSNQLNDLLELNLEEYDSSLTVEYAKKNYLWSYICKKYIYILSK